jgi:flavodoxin
LREQAGLVRVSLQFGPAELTCHCEFAMALSAVLHRLAMPVARVPPEKQGATIKLLFNMKILVVYFSRDGQTGRMAKEIAKQCGADVEAIRELHAGKGALARWRSHWQTLVRASPAIWHPRRNPARYELFIIGSPASRLGVAPAIRSYLGQYRDSLRQVAFFCAEGSGANERIFAMLEKLCGMPPAAIFSVDRKGLPPVAHREVLTDFMSEISRH